MRRLDVHALDLGSEWSDPSHASDADGRVFIERQEEPTVGRQEL